MWNFSNISLSILGTLDQFHVYKISGQFFSVASFFFIFHSYFQEFRELFYEFQAFQGKFTHHPYEFFPFYRGQRNTSWVQQIYFVMRGFITILALFITRFHCGMVCVSSHSK